MTLKSRIEKLEQSQRFKPVRKYFEWEVGTPFPSDYDPEIDFMITVECMGDPTDEEKIQAEGEE